jgi:hypothetical protein
MKGSHGSTPERGRREGEEDKRRHGDGHSEQLAAPTRALCTWLAAVEGRRRRKEKREKKRKRRKRKEKKMWNFFQT